MSFEVQFDKQDKIDLQTQKQVLQANKQHRNDFEQEPTAGAVGSETRVKRVLVVDDVLASGKMAAALSTHAFRMSRALHMTPVSIT